QVCSLRRALGADRDLVSTEPGRGYRFTARIRRNVAAIAVEQNGDPPGPNVWAETQSGIDPPAIAAILAHIDAKLGKLLALLFAHQLCAAAGEPERDDLMAGEHTDPNGALPVC